VQPYGRWCRCECFLISLYFSLTLPQPGCGHWYHALVATGVLISLYSLGSRLVLVAMRLVDGLLALLAELRAFNVRRTTSTTVFSIEAVSALVVYCSRNVLISSSIRLEMVPVDWLAGLILIIGTG